ncbi:MAG: 50S ribosomal protein L23 [Muribaculaceae bacterium]|jgi:large subunit ribosomal protein L23|nr:50S ribosomal protein L23 [Muribaculaceae bacterium]MBQ2491449.1 50S ribosomal protein L23 [Muribaculaceae bacterium]MBQ4139405.1 50S ribosomal protein L23 [Muribaculaceae bacterium]
MNISIIPIVSEKANAISEGTNRFSFKVSPNANKDQIKSLVEKLYDVKVVGVSTMNYEGKKKMRYTKRGIQRGKVAAFKKAIVTVAEGQTIDFYSNL